MPKVLNMFHAVPKADYDKKVKLQKLELMCYSPEKMDQLYSQKKPRVVGEIKANNQQDRIARVMVADKVLPVSALGKHSRLIYRKAGYINIGMDEYVAVLKSRFGFLLLLFLLLLGLVTALGLLLGSLFGKKDEPTVINPMPVVDPNAETIPDETESPSEDPESVGVMEEQGGSVSMIYSLNAWLDLSTGTIDILFQNPGKSTHDVVLEMYVRNGEENVLIAQSGRIPAGSAMSFLTMKEGSASLSGGSYEALYKVLYYDPATGERALVESEITDVKLVVR